MTTEKNPFLKSKVAIARCTSYNFEFVYPALSECLKSINALALFTPGKKVFIKINHLSSVPPEMAVTTHPIILEAIIKILLECDTVPTVGDDIEPSAAGESGFKITGIEQVCRKYNVALLNLKTAGYKKVEIPEGKMIKDIYIAKPILESDLVISAAKLKTHSLTLYTGAIKNMFGCIPQGKRRFLHIHHSDRGQFAAMLVDLFSFIKPQLSIMDAVVGMEGEGPQGGRPRNIGYIMASKDAVALDAVSSAIIGLRPEQVAHIHLAGQRSLGISEIPAIEIKGMPLDQAKQAKFLLPKGIIFGSVPGWLIKLFYTAIAVRPNVITKNCKICDRCVKYCPTGAIKTGGLQAHIDYKKCIDCLCCQEVCPYLAIDTKQYLLGKAANQILSILKAFLNR